jgi:hypothetical protein
MHNLFRGTGALTAKLSEDNCEIVSEAGVSGHQNADAMGVLSFERLRRVQASLVQDAESCCGMQAREAAGSQAMQAPCSPSKQHTLACSLQGLRPKHAKEWSAKVSILPRLSGTVCCVPKNSVTRAVEPFKEMLELVAVAMRNNATI